MIRSGSSQEKKAEEKHLPRHANHVRIAFSQDLIGNLSTRHCATQGNVSNLRSVDAIRSAERNRDASFQSSCDPREGSSGN
jgi:hypothetical protein